MPALELADQVDGQLLAARRETCQRRIALSAAGVPVVVGAETVNARCPRGRRLTGDLLHHGAQPPRILASLRIRYAGQEPVNRSTGSAHRRLLHGRHTAMLTHDPHRSGGTGLGWSALVTGMAGFDDPAFYGDRWAAVYDERHAYMDPEPAVDFLAALAGDGRALELAIGTGRVALPLAARGITVEGVDASAAMVEQLRAKPGGESIPVVIGDM